MKRFSYLRHVTKKVQRRDAAVKRPMRGRLQSLHSSPEAGSEQPSVTGICVPQAEWVA
jgi:hypothetical protein